MALLDRLFVMMPDWMLAGAAPIRGVGSGADGGSSGGNGGLPPAGGNSPPPGAGGLNWLLPMIFLFFLFMIFMQITAGRKQKKQHAAMISGLRKHDKVRMLGGIIGTIAEVHDSEVVIKVDEATNTRIRFSKDAVQSVLKPAAGGVTSEPEKVE